MSFHLTQSIAPIRRAWLASMLMVNILAIASGYAQSKCQAELAAAESRYKAGRFDEAIATVGRCLTKSNVTELERKAAYKLLGKAYLAKDQRYEAKIAIKRLLELAPGFEPDPVQDPLAFIIMVEEVKQEQGKPKAETPTTPFPREEKKGGSKKWLFIGGGVAVAGGVAAFLFLRDDKKDLADLPSPPNFQ